MVVEIFLSRKNKKNILKFYFSWINFNLSLINIHCTLLNAVIISQKNCINVSNWNWSCDWKWSMKIISKIYVIFIRLKKKFSTIHLLINVDCLVFFLGESKWRTSSVICCGNRAYWYFCERIILQMYNNKCYTRKTNNNFHNKFSRFNWIQSSRLKIIIITSVIYKRFSRI